MENTLDNLTVLRGLLKDKIFGLFARAQGNPSEFIAEFYNRKNCPEAGTNFMRYAEYLIIHDENAVARTLAAKKEPSPTLQKAYLRDLEIISDSVNAFDDMGFFQKTPSDDFANKTPSAIYETLKEKYAALGYGKFMQSYVLKFADGDVFPIDDKKGVTLKDLKDYAEQKKIISDNFENFCMGLPFSDMLLYGDKGTGKSSTVRAMAKEYFKKGLRLVELPARHAENIGELKKLLAGEPLKFAIFIDDLSFDAGDGRYSELKADIEGTSDICDNVMIVATSNRRHIIKESFSDRDDAVHKSDAIEEQLSLSDRFGLTVLFSNTDKGQYLSIVAQLAADKGINMAKQELFALAERFAVIKGGRSPRRAEQFTDIALAAQVKGVEPDF